ncbi:cytochrome P450 71AU50-like [Andrographis paniculata]|uniref:cytochrome P450 71AU50-like n=1 Tax=Andrographis paniculata TaxID=175694 RepID=UPI0021E8B4E9|nr:cytochrome P450 71AU50-like [Andrographis paniculata]
MFFSVAWIWAPLCALTLYLHLHSLLVRKKKKKKKKQQWPPSPRGGLPILGHLHLLLRKNPHHVLCDLARKHGPIMGLRLGFVPAVVVSSPAAAELVLRTHDRVFANRPSQQAVKFVGYGQRGVVFSPYGPYLRSMRKLIASSLRMSQSGAGATNTNTNTNKMEAELGLLVESLKQAARRREKVDLGIRIFSLTRDVICRMVFGRKSVSNLDEEGFKLVISEALELAAKFNAADYYPSFVGSLDLQRMNRRMKRLIDIFDGLLEGVVEDHVRIRKMHQEQEQEQDFVDIMLGVMESGKAVFPFDRRHVKAVALDLMIAGTDAPASAIEWGLTELIRHPQAMQKLQEELASVVGMGTDESRVKEWHLDRLEYLNCVVKETLRLHPPVPMLVPHEAMEDCVLDGFHIPRKSRVLVNAWAIGRDPDAWQDPDPLRFSPERFAGAAAEFMGGDHFRLLAFGFGRRSCPGMQLGLRMVKLGLAQLVHCFRWELPDGMQPRELDMTEHFGIGTCKAEHLMAIPVYRLLK